MTFIVPGLVMMAVIQNSYTNVVSTFFSAKFMKNLEELLVSPVPPWLILSGFCTGGLVRGAVTGGLVMGVSLFFTRPPVLHPWAVLLFLLLTALLFSLGGFLNGVFARKFDDIGIFATFVLTPLTYLGGVFYSVSSLPPVWQMISKANPILYMVDGFRYGFFGTSSVSPWTSALVLSVVCVALAAVNLRMLRTGKGIRN
jgi:ABC-2 type transport system permease protein